MVDALVIPLLIIGTLLGMSALVIIASTIHHCVKAWRTHGAEMAQREKEERDYVDTMKDRDDPVVDEEPDPLDLTDQRFRELQTQLDEMDAIMPEQLAEAVEAGTAANHTHAMASGTVLIEDADGGRTLRRVTMGDLMATALPGETVVEFRARIASGQPNRNGDIIPAGAVVGRDPDGNFTNQENSDPQGVVMPPNREERNGRYTNIYANSGYGYVGGGNSSGSQPIGDGRNNVGMSSRGGTAPPTPEPETVKMPKADEPRRKLTRKPKEET